MTDPVPRHVLPIPQTPYDGPLPADARDPEASFPPIERLRPPEGAPNVLVILLDDVGSGASSAFGGPCATPTAERLAGNGLTDDAADDADHLVSPEERFRVAMARQ